MRQCDRESGEFSIASVVNIHWLQVKKPQSKIWRRSLCGPRYQKLQPLNRNSFYLERECVRVPRPCVWLQKYMCDIYSCNGAHPIVLGARYCLPCLPRTRHLLRLLLRSAESLSTAIIPSKTSAVIPAMFHQSVAVYSEAHCQRMLARTKIMACECLSVCASARLLFFFQPPNLLSFLRTNTSKRSWADKLALFSTAVAQWSPACVCVCVNN